MIYTLHQLLVFSKIAQHQSITKAAESLGLTQPAISIQLRNFQSQFDIPLTEIVGRKLYVTDFGKEIADAANRILEEIESINLKTAAYKGYLSGKLKLAVVSTGKYVMPYLLTDFVKAHPDVEIVMDVANRQQVLLSIERNEVDFALIHMVPDHFSGERLELMPNKFYLVCNSEQKPMMQKVNRGLVSSMPMIFRESGSGTRMLMERFLEKAGIRAKKKMELTSNEAVKQAVVAGLGCSVMPVFGIRNELRSGLLQKIDYPGLPIESTWNLIWLKGKSFSPSAGAFLAHLREQGSSLVEKHFGWSERLQAD